MSWLTDVRERARAIVFRRREERAMEEELRFHLEMETERNIARGLTPENARRSARRAFGGADQVREDVRDARGVRPFEDLRTDVRLALRTLARAPSFTIVVLTTLALGIGATAAIFTVIDGVLLRPVPIAAMDELVVVWETDRASGTVREPGSWPDFIDFRERTRTLSAIAAFSGADLDYLPADPGDAERVSGVAATANFPALLGVEPVIGRAFSPEEDRPGAERVVMLGETFWRARFDGDASVLGRTVRLNDVAHTVVGVMPAGAGISVPHINARADYHAPYSGGESVEVWLPLRADAASSPRETHPFLLVGRLAPGATVARAQRDLAAIAADLEAAYPENEARGVHVEPLRDVVFAEVRPALVMLGGAVVLVLLIACANVAGLLLARGRAHARQTAVRAALGASGGRLARQFLAENLLLAVLGATGGIGLAYVALGALTRLIPADVPRATTLDLDVRALALAAALSVVLGLLFALVPLMHARRTPAHVVMREEAGRGATPGRRGTRFRSALVVSELAFSVVLAVGAVLLIRSLDRLHAVDPGFRTEGVLKVSYQLPAARYPRDFADWPNWREVHAFNDGVLERVRTLPGVTAAAIAEAHPLDPGYTNSFTVVGREGEARDWPEITIRKVTPGYFETVRLDVVRGRPLGTGDATTTDPVALINETAAARFFDGREPIGERVRFWGIDRTIVGVVGDERVHGLAASTPPALYVPLAQVPSGQGTLLVRTTGDPMALAAAVGGAVRAHDPGIALFGVEPLAQTVRHSVGQERFTTLLLALFAGLALVLAAIGVYGLLSLVVAQRTRELGIRMALGADPRQLVRLIVGHAVRLAGAGVALGLAGALAAAQLMHSLLFGVSATDPVALGAAAAAILGVALLASAGPARRAVGSDPLRALRME